MLSKTSEAKLRGVRALLTAGWLVLIASLFWDPVTPAATRPDNVTSPFHLQGRHVEVQGQVLPEDPYAMGNRIWWTMLIPILPLFFLVAGHEAWRRICPLSFVSQIPRYLGWQRKRPALDRRTGKVSRLLALPAREGWARRNVWYIQFGLLFIGLNVRLLFINSDRIALASFLIGVIIIAMVVGALFGGKTWCNYICPVAVVQKIYTQPGGLLESNAHTVRIPISQSMCRAPGGAKGDQSTCVGCTPSCPDIDLEKSHWDSLFDHGRRNVYYMFFGLVVGFYTYYYLYSGNWDYYFSGAWTHERDQLASLLSPGFFINGVVVPIPKIVAAPLALGAFVAASLGLGIVLERAYTLLRKRFGRALSDEEIRNHCLVFSAYITINTFYMFGGRPNLSLLPTPALKAVDILIVALSTLWFWRGIHRTPFSYRRESLASSLMQQLRSLKVDLTRFLEGRKLEELKPDEVYVLAKTLPQFSRDQKLAAYRNILEEALQQGRTNSAASLEVLREVRVELGVDDDEHRAVLADLGVAGAEALDPAQAATYENWIRLQNYRRSLELALIGPLERGESLAAALQHADVRKEIVASREMYRITPEEHEAALAQVTGHGGLLFERARAMLEPITRIAAIRLGLAGLMPPDEDCAALARLLGKVLQQRLVGVCGRVFSTLLTLGDSAEALWLARNLANVLGGDLEVALRQPVSQGSKVAWEESLGSQVLLALRGEVGEPLAGLPAPTSYRQVVDGAIDLIGNLELLAGDGDPRLRALAIVAISYLDVGRARQVATSVLQEPGTKHWLLAETLASVVGETGKGSAEGRRFGAITITVASPNAGTRTYTLDKPYMTVGRDPGNDIVIAHPSAAPFHFAISLAGSEVEVRPLDPMVQVRIDGKLLDAATRIESGSRIALRGEAGAPTLVASWSPREATGFTLQAHDTITRMIWLSQVRVFEGLDLEALADTAETSEVRVYAAQACLCREGEQATEAFVLQSGRLQVTSRGRRLGELEPGAIVGEIGVITRRPRAATVTLLSERARIVTLDGERLRKLLAVNSAVAAGLLVGVAGYVAAGGTPTTSIEEAA